MLIRLYEALRSKIIDWSLCLKHVLGIRTTLLRLQSGEHMQIRNSDIVGRLILKGRYEPALRNVLVSQVRAGMTVLDVGANIGYYTVQLANMVGACGRVLAFEPNPVLCDELKCNIDLNHFTNTLVFPFALSDSFGESSFYLPADGLEAHGSLKMNSTFEVIQCIRVRTRKLDEVLSETVIAGIGFMKIDVEGAEGLIMRGARGLLTSRTKPVVLFECSETLCSRFGFRVFDILKEIVSLGYNVEQIDYGNWLARPNP